MSIDRIQFTKLIVGGIASNLLIPSVFAQTTANNFVDSLLN